MLAKTTTLLSSLLCAATTLLALEGQRDNTPKPPTDAALALIQDVADLPRILITGDSISIGHTLPARERLRGKGNLHCIPDNASSTGIGLKKHTGWLGINRWDVMDYNFGLHDGTLPPEGAGYSSLDHYEMNLRESGRQLRTTGAKLNGASTTAVPNGCYLTRNRRFGDVAAYNTIAANIMLENGIVINDLHALITPRLTKMQQSNRCPFLG